MESLTGKLLVAAPGLADPNFARAVVAIANHDDDGALGVILNRPSDSSVAEAVPDLGVAVRGDDTVYVGGPVQPEAIVVLAEFHDPSRAAFVICERVGLVSDETSVESLGGVTERCRVFAGYAGWGPGQLEIEIDREDWIVEPAAPDDVFAADAAALWSDVLDRKGGEWRLVARMPLDPTLN